jgi:hypothetical protein
MSHNTYTHPSKAFTERYGFCLITDTPGIAVCTDYQVYGPKDPNFGQKVHDEKLVLWKQFDPKYLRSTSDASSLVGMTGNTTQEFHLQFRSDIPHMLITLDHWMFQLDTEFFAGDFGGQARRVKAASIEYVVIKNGGAYIKYAPKAPEQYNDVRMPSRTRSILESVSMRRSLSDDNDHDKEMMCMSRQSDEDNGISRVASRAKKAASKAKPKKEKAASRANGSRSGSGSGSGTSKRSGSKAKGRVCARAGCTTGVRTEGQRMCHRHR